MKFACIGNIVLDCTVSCDKFIIEGIRNSFFDPVYNTGGPAFNAASVLTKFGNSVDFYGQIGNDANGKYICDEMLAENIDLTHLSVSKNIITPTSFVVVNTSNNKRTICSMRSKDDYEFAHMERFEYETNYDYILTDGKYIKESLKLLLENPKAISIIDAGRYNRNTAILCGFVSYVICSEDFANEATKMTINDDMENNKEIFNILKRRYKRAKGIAITVGERGYICEKDGEIVTIPPYKTELSAIDTNCAGDIFHGAFTHAIANGHDFHESLDFANITASISTTRTGGRTSCPSLTEVNEKYSEDVKQKRKKM